MQWEGQLRRPESETVSPGPKVCRNVPKLGVLPYPPQARWSSLPRPSWKLNCGLDCLQLHIAAPFSRTRSKRYLIWISYQWTEKQRPRRPVSSPCRVVTPLSYFSPESRFTCAYTVLHTLTWTPYGGSHYDISISR